MKKLFVLLCAISLFCACKPQKSDYESRILADALCKMDISSQGNRNTKSEVEIIGDSIAVHKLSRWMGWSHFDLIDFGHPDYWVETWYDQESSHLEKTGRFNRDTIRYTFTFYNQGDIINWMSFEGPNSEYGVDGTEFLGSIICAENLAFSAMYDAEIYSHSDETKTYFDPLENSKYWDSVMGYRRIGYDTLGYIPNSQLRANRVHAQNLLDERKFQELLDFFRTAYHIYTCTGEEYRELVRLGLN